MTTNISRIILSQSINSLNLHEYAKMNPYEKELHTADYSLNVEPYRL